MKKFIQIIIVIIITAGAAVAQPMMSTMDAPQVTAGALEEENGTMEAMTVSYNAAAKQVPSNFNGYKIQIVASATELSADHAIFNQFGGITVENVNGTYCYAIGNFDSATKAEGFASKVIAEKYADYKVVAYNNGARK